jgi:hypothetical protein
MDLWETVGMAKRNRRSNQLTCSAGDSKPMPAIACIPPWAMKEILEHFGFQVIAEDEYNWVMSETKGHLGVAGPEEKEPLILPKLGDLLALDVMMDTLIKAKLGLAHLLCAQSECVGYAGFDSWRCRISRPR